MPANSSCSSDRRSAGKARRCAWSPVSRRSLRATSPLATGASTTFRAPTRHRDGVSELRALSAHVRPGQHGIRPRAAKHVTFVASFVGNPSMNLLPGALVDHDGVSAWVSLPSSLTKAARTSAAADVVLGVRPEDVAVDGSTPNNSPLTGSLELVEPLGHQHLLHLRVGSSTVTVRAAPGERPPLGTTLPVRFDPAACISSMGKQASTSLLRDRSAPDVHHRHHARFEMLGNVTVQHPVAGIRRVDQ